MKKQIYLDYAASSPLDPTVLKAMMPYLRQEWGNPSSSHSFGQRSRAAIENSRETVAKFLNCGPLEVVFTSGATEANNLAIQGVLKTKNYQLKTAKPHVIVSKIEHESVLSPIQELEAQGKIKATYIAPNKEGIISPADIEKAIQNNTVLVSIMYANSEIGTIQPIAEVGVLLKKAKIVFHTDAVQAAQFLDCDVQKLGVDLLTLSGHKIYGPKGVGALYIKERTGLSPLNVGGGQEQGMRSGTENVAGVVGMG
ncbi:MAG: cysteine desulfurase family protein, partial [bacterium]|nr:cysteine desulfurase family protein [bacterium]